jgi:hypothetical protein
VADRVKKKCNQHHAHGFFAARFLGIIFVEVAYTDLVDTASRVKMSVLSVA